MTVRFGLELAAGLLDSVELAVSFVQIVDD
jgi:hypothetical protein